MVHLRPTSPGSIHDKKPAGESSLIDPSDALMLKDTGFQGYEPPGTAALQPKKKPRGRELYPIQKTLNQVLTWMRAGTGHAIAGVK